MVLHRLFLNLYKKHQQHFLKLGMKVFHAILNQKPNVLDCTTRSNNLLQYDNHQLYFYLKELLIIRYDKVHNEAWFFVPTKLKKPLLNEFHQHVWVLLFLITLKVNPNKKLLMMVNLGKILQFRLLKPQ